MSITDELREYSKGWEKMSRVRGDLDAIADHIDAEHEHAVMSAMNDALYHANDESMAELGWARLPKDADGVPIHLGDEVESDYHEDGTVVGMQLIVNANGHVITMIAVRPHGRDTPTWYDPESYRHHHDPTVEDVLREFALACEDAGNAGPEVERIAAEYAAKLRLAGDE